MGATERGSMLHRVEVLRGKEQKNSARNRNYFEQANGSRYQRMLIPAKDIFVGTVLFQQLHLALDYFSIDCNDSVILL